MATAVRIAFCITELDPGGAERALARIVCGLDGSRWEPHVVALGNWGEIAEELQAAGVPVTCLGARGASDLSVFWRLIRWLRHVRPQILQTFLFHANVAGRLAGRLAGIPTIVSGYRVAEGRHRWHHRLEQATHRLATAHVCVSEGVAEHCLRNLGIAEAKLHVIRNGVDFDRFAQASPRARDEWGLTTGDFLAVTVGRLDPQKGLMTLCEAFAPLLKANPRLHLLIVGEGPERDRLEAWRRDAGLESRVLLPGRQEDVAGILRAADLFVLASEWEGMPNVVLEAMASGCPVVATNVEGIPELLGDSDRGIVVTPKSVNSLRLGVERLMGDPGLRDQLSRDAQHFVKEHLTWHGVIRDYDRLYRELLGEGPIA